MDELGICDGKFQINILWNCVIHFCALCRDIRSSDARRYRSEPQNPAGSGENVNESDSENAKGESDVMDGADNKLMKPSSREATLIRGEERNARKEPRQALHVAIISLISHSHLRVRSP
jgi:hypothetical protein